MTNNHLGSCKTCGKEIAKGVKKCPHCGKDQRSFFGRHKILSFIGVLILFGIIGSALGGGEEASNEGSSAATASAPVKEQKIYKVGEAVPADKVEITVTKFEEKEQVGNEYINKSVSEGGTFAAIQYKIKNTSKKPVGMFDYPSVRLVDEEGTEYDSDIDASSNYAIETNVDNAKIASDLNPGITVTDTKVFEVSKQSFDAGSWFIKIGDEKVQLK
ncbi:DUF4352 domain-containing protein [Mesobacillus jeotgali]|jgi:hypothetical protein|uniref:DUF4352 domain-containing protein n=1 Tax=Mesobacillus jeotgali TaxID=129985 RepID=A0ABY9VKC7_9BACI|nr:DUF4352 domain-containing protein [Mesobacillus jeotgali]WNF23594.1 DUF4352 domain-containing protein [Mesobacillus jeotgali]